MKIISAVADDGPPRSVSFEAELSSGHDLLAEAKSAFRQGGALPIFGAEWQIISYTKDLRTDDVKIEGTSIGEVPASVENMLLARAEDTTEVRRKILSRSRRVGFGNKN